MPSVKDAGWSALAESRLKAEQQTSARAGGACFKQALRRIGCPCGPDARMNELLVILPVIIPLAGAAVGLCLAGWPRGQRWWCFAAMVAALVSSGVLLREVMTSGAPVVFAGGGWRAPFGIVFVGDLLGATMTVMSLAVMTAGMGYGLGCKDQCVNAPTFFPLFLALAAGLNGGILTGDIFNLFVFTELVVISGAALTALSDDEYGVEAAYKYFYISILAGVFLLLAAGCLYAAYGTLNVADLAGRIAATPDAPLAGVALVCLLAYCFVKSAVVPFHFWQPDFHTAAPTPVHAVLSSVVVKLGVVWLLRMTTVLFPVAMEPVSGLLVALGVVGIFFGGWGATGTYDAKRMLAYSTMGQIGFILVGIGWGTPLAIAAAIVYAVNHSLAKAALLMLAGSVASRAPVKTAKFAAITGLGRAMPLGGALFLLGGMALAVAGCVPSREVTHAPGEPGRIAFSLTIPGRVSLAVYDRSSGRQYRELLRGETLPAGEHAVAWDGLDRDGQPVAPGTYEWRLVASPGLRAEFQFLLGKNPPHSPIGEWPGNHSSVSCLAVDETGFYLGANHAEARTEIVKQSRDWKQQHWAIGQTFDGHHPLCLAVADGKLFALTVAGGLRRYDRVTGKIELTKDFTWDGVKANHLSAHGAMLALAFREKNAVRLVDARTLSVTETISVPAPVATAGNLLIITGDNVVDRAGRVVVTGLTNPQRLALDGETLYVAEGAASQQIKRFGGDGRLQATFGRAGGREFGRYVAENFRDIADLVADGRGHLIIAEPVAPRRTAIVNGQDGRIVAEYYGGQAFYMDAVVDPKHPEDVFFENYRGTYTHAKVDYARRTWRVHAVYTHEPDFGGSPYNQFQFVDGQLRATAKPVVFRVDEASGKWVVAGELPAETLPVPLTENRGHYRDADGNLYVVAIGNRYPGEERHGYFWPACELGIARFFKWSPIGELLFATSRHGVVTGARGELFQPSGILGETHDCLVLRDRGGQPSAVAWTKDGLYVGTFLDRRANDGLPAHIYDWHWWKDDALVGELVTLANGEVYWFAPGPGEMPVFRITGWDEITHQRGTVEVGAVTGAAQQGTGLRGTYYRGDAVAFTRVDSRLRFGALNDNDSGAGAPAEFDDLRVVWEGELEPVLTEPHLFSVYFTGLCKLWVAGQLVLNSAEGAKPWSRPFCGDLLGPAKTLDSAPVTLTAGRRVPVKIEWRALEKVRTKDSGYHGPLFHLHWETRTQDRQTIPATALYPVASPPSQPAD